MRKLLTSWLVVTNAHLHLLQTSIPNNNRLTAPLAGLFQLFACYGTQIQEI